MTTYNIWYKTRQGNEQMHIIQEQSNACAIAKAWQLFGYNLEQINKVLQSGNRLESVTILWKFNGTYVKDLTL